MAWLIAWIKLICGMTIPPIRGCSGVYVVGDFRRRGQFARAREFDGVGEFLFGFGDDLFKFGRAYLAALRAPLLEANQRAFELPFLDLGLLAIRAAAEKGLLADDVPLPSIGLAFEQGGTCLLYTSRCV